MKNTNTNTKTNSSSSTTSLRTTGSTYVFPAKAPEGNQERLRQLQKELSTLRRAAAILQAEFGADPTQPREMGYALCKGLKELQREYRACGGKEPEDRYNPFWSDSRRR